jgi:predicted Na+-dependent transporter
MMGTQLKFHVLKRILMRPIGPIIGTVCQCVIMPLVSFVDIL